MTEEQRAEFRKLFDTVRYYYFAEGTKYIASQHFLRMADDTLNHWLSQFPEDVIEAEYARLYTEEKK
jgi:hypothetical protein